MIDSPAINEHVYSTSSAQVSPASNGDWSHAVWRAQLASSETEIRPVSSLGHVRDAIMRTFANERVLFIPLSGQSTGYPWRDIAGSTPISPLLNEAAIFSGQRLAYDPRAFLQWSQPVPPMLDLVQTIATELADIGPNWDGDGALAPRKEVIDDISNSMLGLASLHAEPELEVDTDGSVALVWQDSARTVALTFMGNGRVVGTVSPQSADRHPWSVGTADWAALRGYFEREGLAEA